VWGGVWFVKIICGCVVGMEGHAGGGGGGGGGGYPPGEELRENNSRSNRTEPLG